MADGTAAAMVAGMLRGSERAGLDGRFAVLVLAMGRYNC